MKLEVGMLLYRVSQSNFFYSNIQFESNSPQHPNFGYPVFTKRRPSNGIDFLGKYRVTKVGVLQTV